MPDYNEDARLTRTDVQALSSADALAAFFTRLGYPDETRLPMTAEALSLNRSLQDATLHVERLTSVDATDADLLLYGDPPPSGSQMPVRVGD